MALIDRLNAIGDAIRDKNGTTEKIPLIDMPQAIAAIETGGGVGDIPEEAYKITGNCERRFANGGWDWFIENYGDKITTEDISNAKAIFFSSYVERIPFELNFKANTEINLNQMFSGCKNLLEVPKINNCKIKDMDYIFDGCAALRNLPEDIADWFDWSLHDTATSKYSGSRTNMFNGCFSLRSIPMSFLSHVNPIAVGNYSYLNGGFNNCYALDELVDLPIPYTETWTSNVFYSTFDYCSRLKALTFAKPDGQPYVMNWKSQTINLSLGIGYGVTVFSYNSGITADKEVKDDATYQALKDDPDWFTKNDAYSRYNHDSAVATINSLPDTSAYLAANGGTNTIKFKGAAGRLTDGGAINTLTEEEIAVAAAKGWTVTLV